MTPSIQNRPAGYALPSFTETVSTAAKEMGYLTQKFIELGSNVLADCGRGTDFASQWIKDYSNCSPDVKESAGRVKAAADRFNVFGAFCDTVLSGQDLIQKPINGVNDAVNIVGGYLASSTDFVGRLAGTRVISLGSALPVVDGVGTVATVAVGLNGAREDIQNSGEGDTKVGLMLRVAKNVTLAVFAAFAGISACFAKIAAMWTSLPLCVLASGTAYLALKVTSIFYDKLALPTPLELASKV